MNKKVLILLLPIVLVFSMLLVSAGDFKIEYGGSAIFTVETSGNVNASGTLAESGVLLSNIYLALAGGTLTGAINSDSNISTSAYFNGSGKYLTGISTINATYAAFAVNGTKISWNNITDFPTCGAGEHLLYNGTALNCTSSSVDYTKIAYYNHSVTWAEDQIFDKVLNVTTEVRLMTDDSAITGSTGTTNISIDSSGNVVIRLG